MTKVLSGNNVLALNAVEKVYINDFNVDGTYGTNAKGSRNNAKIALDCKDLVIKNAEIVEGCTAYNIFEQKQSVTYPTQTVKVSKLTSANTIVHNVLNFYNLADNATIEISDSDFDLNVATSNIMRLSNYKNASNVTVTFKNVNWNYETVGGTADDFTWAGLIIFQPAGADAALTGNYDYIKTWKFVFDNCTYNGEKVTSNNFGEHNQVMYAYNFNNSGKIEDPSNFELNMEFK